LTPIPDIRVMLNKNEKIMEKLFLILIFTLSAALLLSSVIERTYYFEEPKLKSSGEYTRIFSKDLEIITLPGYPEIPSQEIKLLLPPAEASYTITLEYGEKIEIPKEVDLFPIQQPYPLSYEGNIEFTDENLEIYSSELKYPVQNISNTQTQYYKGHSILIGNITPFEYYPLQQKLYYFDSITITIETNIASEAENAYNNFYRSSTSPENSISRIVQNPEQLFSYPSEYEMREAEVDFYIITSSTYEADFASFISFKKSQGYTTELKLTNDIYTEYTGIDNADKIRNFIIDAYQNYGTEYVLLGGDTEIIPHRGFYLAAGSTIDDDLPSDLYFSALDRVGTGAGPDWNTDNDSYWGETSEADYFAEVMIGRISADSHSEFAAALNKQIMYQNSPVTSDLEKAIMTGENLNNSPLTWGATYKDEILNGGSYNGYTTAGFPVYFDIQTQYDRTATWSWSELKNKFNNGVNLVNHLGHSNTSYNMKFYTSYVTNGNLTTNGINHNFYIIYSQGCYPAAFDNRDSNGNYGADVIVEAFTTIENGCVAFLGNTRYGWYNPGGTNSGSQYLDRQFFDSLFGENIYQIAAMHEDSRYDGASQCNGDPWFRWAFYEVTLFGDPSLDVWTAVPDDITASYPSGIVMGETQIGFETNVPDARIGLVQEGVLIGRGKTDGNGDLQLDLFNPVTSVENIEVSIIAHNKNRLSGSIIVVSNEPYVLYNSLQINDASGNNNDAADYGENIYLTIELNNAGNQPAQGVNAILSSASSYVSILDNSEYYGNIGASSQVIIDNGYQVTIADDIPDLEQINFNLEITGSDRYTWYSEFTLTVNAPNFQAISWQIDDSVTGNSNSRLDPGETVDLIIVTQNTGHSASPTGSADLVCLDDEIVLNNSSVALGSFSASQTENVIFNITVDSEASIGTPVQFDYSLTAGNYSYDTSETFMIGLIFDDFENGNFNNFDWQLSGDADWFVTSSAPYEGDYCIQSGDVNDYGISTLSVNADILASGLISFFRKTSSESSYDYLRFFIDDVQQDQWGGELSWAEVYYPVSSGNHTFKWIYEKDSSISNGSDCGWVDYIVFPAIEIPGIPDIALDTESFDIQLLEGETSEHDLRISNMGDGTLNYSIALDYATRNNGGPDTFGYTWIDSDELNGPDYNWIDISGSATEVTFSHNDYASSPIPIGFSFNFYDQDHTEFRINPNGWIGFGDDWTDYHNYEIPRADAPKPAIFGFWDDLDPLQGGNVYYKSSPERLVIWFDNVIHYPGINNGTYDFEIVLYPNGDILLQYRNLSGDLNTCSVGIQNTSGDDGLQIAYNEEYLHNNLAVRITKPLNWLQVSPASSSIPENEWEDINIQVSAAELTLGTYECDILINSNDPDESGLIVPFILNVTNSTVPPPENVRMYRAGNYLVLSWESVPGAISYNIYSSDESSTGFTLTNSTSQNQLLIPVGSRTKFYKVTAVN